MNPLGIPIATVTTEAVVGPELRYLFLAVAKPSFTWKTILTPFCKTRHTRPSRNGQFMDELRRM